MQLTVTVKLKTTPDQHAALAHTLRTCNAACNAISATAFATSTFRQYDLHALVYHLVKAQTNLNANHVVRAIAFQANADVNAAKVLEARATLSTGPRFPLAALAARGEQAVPPLGGGS